jgi:hypothetical protein
MSGGSYDYLCFKADDLSGRRGTVEEMAQRLEGLPYASPAAADTRRVLALLDEARALAERLSDVWHAVEWWDSGDYGEDDAREAIAKYRDISTTT